MAKSKDKIARAMIAKSNTEVNTLKTDYENLGNLNKNKLKGVNIEPSTNLTKQKEYVDRFYTVDKGDTIAVIVGFALNTTTNAITEETTYNPVTKQLIQYIRGLSGKPKPIVVRLAISNPHTAVPTTNSFGAMLFGDRYDAVNDTYDPTLSPTLSTSCWLYHCQQWSKYCIDNNIDTVFLSNEWVYATDKQANVITNFVTVLKSYCAAYNPNFNIKFGMTVTSSIELPLIEESTNGSTIFNAVDIIGVNVYPHIHYNGPNYTYTAADLRRNMYEYMQNIEKVAIKYGKPIYITEIGACANNLGLVDTSTSTTAIDPTSVQRDDLQAMYFKLIFETVYMNIYVKGFFLFIAGNIDGISNKRGYQFQGRTASENIVIQYYGGEINE